MSAELMTEQECTLIARLHEMRELSEEDSYRLLELQTRRALDTLTVRLAELDTLVKQIKIPESASSRAHMKLQCLPMYVWRPRVQLRAMQSAFPAWHCDPFVALGALTDACLIWVDCALRVVRPIAAKGMLKRREVRELDTVESVLGEAFSGFYDVHKVLCDEELAEEVILEGFTDRPPGAASLPVSSAGS